MDGLQKKFADGQLTIMNQKYLTKFLARIRLRINRCRETRAQSMLSKQIWPYDKAV
jgi:hypothetical protein